MLRTIIIAIVIFCGLSFFEMDKEADKLPEAPDLKIEEHDKEAAQGLVLSLLPPQEEWPEAAQKFYLAFNLEEAIEPYHESPHWLAKENIPQYAKDALVAIEDHNFYEHGALSAEGVMRAFLVNMTEGEIVQGGSTLTQQLVKNLFLSPEQHLSRKVEEAILSFMLEEKYPKDEILEIYLNTTYFGAGATGLAEASTIYFDKEASQLTLAESAIIASLPYAPSALNPLENPDGCKQRQKLVLKQMVKYDYISQ